MIILYFKENFTLFDFEHMRKNISDKDWEEFLLNVTYTNLLPSFEKHLFESLLITILNLVPDSQKKCDLLFNTWKKEVMKSLNKTIRDGFIINGEFAEQFKKMGIDGECQRILVKKAIDMIDRDYFSYIRSQVRKEDEYGK